MRLASLLGPSGCPSARLHIATSWPPHAVLRKMRSQSTVRILIYLSEVADTVFQKIHQQFAFASPNEVLEGRVRQTLTRKTPPANKQTRPRDEDGNWENDPMHDGVQHRARRTRHSSPEPAESPASVAVASLASSLASRPGAGATISSESALQFDAAMEEGVPARDLGSGAAGEWP